MFSIIITAWHGQLQARLSIRMVAVTHRAVNGNMQLIEHL